MCCLCWVWGGEIIEMSKYRYIVMDIFVNTYRAGLNSIVNRKVVLQNFSTSGARKQVSIVAGEESSARKKRETLKRQVWGVDQRLSLKDMVLLLTEIFMVQQKVQHGPRVRKCCCWLKSTCRTNQSTWNPLEIHLKSACRTHQSTQTSPVLVLWSSGPQSWRVSRQTREETQWELKQILTS